MPFAGYPDFQACVADNQDKQSPEGYCQELEQQATGANMTTYPTLVIPEGIESSDGRSYPVGILTWRDKYEFMFTDTTTEGHLGAVHVGNLTNLRRQYVDGVSWIVGDLTYDTDEVAREAERLATEDKLRRVSADVAMHLEVVDVDEDGQPIVEMVSAEIIGTTQTPMSAFGDARVLVGEETSIVTDETPLVAAANPKAKRDWFADPQLPGPTPLTVTDEGRVYGHLATWGTCHIGFDGVCVTAPESKSEYSYFNLGAVNIDGEDIACGHITLGTGHATLSADAESAARHYDDTGSVVADIKAGEDEHGVWVSGAIRPGADIDALRSASLSGDWRRVEGDLELVAALAVNVPGFPIPRLAASVADGDQLSLVASGVVEHRDREDLIYEALRLLTEEVRALRSQPEIVMRADGYAASSGDDLSLTLEEGRKLFREGQEVEIVPGPAGRIAALLDS